MAEEEKKLIITPLDESTEKIGEVLANDTCRKILNLLASEPLSSSQISEKLNSPLTTVEYNIDRLSEAGLITVHHKKFSTKGRRVNFYAPAEKFILIAPKSMQPAKIMRTLRTLALPVVAILILTIGIFGAYNYTKSFGTGAELKGAEKTAGGTSPEQSIVNEIPAAGREAAGGAEVAPEKGGSAVAAVTAGNFTNNTNTSQGVE